MTRRRNPAHACTTAEELRARVLLPDRPQLAAAKKVARRATGGASAWEAMATAGLIPEAWVGSRARFFYSGDMSRLQNRPMNVDQAVALASDPEGVATAEALAVETARRLRDWRPVGGESPPGVASFLWLTQRWPPPVRGVGRYVEEAVLAIVGALPVVERTDGAVWQAQVYLRLRDGWDEFVAAGLRVPAVKNYLGGRVELVTTGRAFADLPNPYAPLVDLWCTGYMLELISDRTARLYAPRATPVKGDR